MAFLREGAVKDLIERGPSFDDLLDWSAENILYADENPSAKIVNYAHDHEMTVPEFETFINIQLAALVDKDDNMVLDAKDILQDLLLNIEEGRQHKEINESHYPRLNQ